MARITSAIVTIDPVEHGWDLVFVGGELRECIGTFVSKETRMARVGFLERYAWQESFEIVCKHRVVVPPDRPIR